MTQRVMYLARRNPRFTHDEWVSEWRAHWWFAQTQPETAGVARYAQNEVLVDLAAAPHDGLASSEYVSSEAKQAMRSSAHYREVMREDERRIFDRIVGDTSVVVEHREVSGRSTAPFAVVRFVVRRSGVTAASFESIWSGTYALRAAGLTSEIVGYAQNLAMPPERPEGWGLAVDAAEEFRFDDSDAARRFLASDDLAALTASTEIFEVVDAMVTAEIVLRDRAHEERVPGGPRT